MFHLRGEHASGPNLIVYLRYFFPLSSCFLVLNVCFPRASGSSTHLSTCPQPSSHHAAFVIPNLPRLLLAHASPASAITPPRPLFPHHRSSRPFPVSHKQTSSSPDPSAVTVLCTRILNKISARATKQRFYTSIWILTAINVGVERFWSRLTRASYNFCRYASCQISDFNICKRDTAGYFLKEIFGTIFSRARGHRAGYF